MILDGVLGNYADLLPGGVNFSGPKELTQYYVKSFAIQKKKIQDKDAFVVSVTLGRRLLGTFLTVYFPTILLNIIGYATNLFKIFFFEVRLIRFFLISTKFLFLGCDKCKLDIHVGPHHNLH